MFERQERRCIICKTEEPGGHGVWHLHHTGSKKAGTIKIHGLTCHKCNWAARQGTREDIAWLRAVADFCEAVL
jgi:hypothetical protein